MARLEAEHAAERRRAHHRAVGLRADRERHHAGRDRGGGAGRRAARRAVEIVRIARLARMEIGELRGHRLADDDGAGGAEPRHHLRVTARAAAGELRRAAFGRHVLGVEDILHRHRNAVQRPGRITGETMLVERARLRQRMVGIEADERAHLALDRGDTVETGAGVILGGNHAAGHFGGGFGGGQRSKIGWRHGDEFPVKARAIKSQAHERGKWVCSSPGHSPSFRGVCCRPKSESGRTRNPDTKNPTTASTIFVGLDSGFIRFANAPE